MSEQKEGAAAALPPILDVRYYRKSRRYYIPSEKSPRYVTSSELLQEMRKGFRVRVTHAESGERVTEWLLTQLLHDELRAGRMKLNVEQRTRLLSWLLDG